ncbi:hypothetical protein Emed_006784 [Eimeria media]
MAVNGLLSLVFLNEWITRPQLDPHGAPLCLITALICTQFADLAPPYRGEPHYSLKLVFLFLFLFCLKSQASLAFTSGPDQDLTSTNGENAVGLSSEPQPSDLSSHASAWGSSADEAVVFSQYDANRPYLHANASSEDAKPGRRKLHKKTAVGALALAAIAVLFLGRFLTHQVELVEAGADAQREPFFYGLDALYAGNIDLEKAREAARRWPVSSLERFEQEALELLTLVDGLEAEAAVSNLRNLIREARLEESRLQEVLPASATLSTPEATQVARTTQARASLDRLRQHFDSALGEAHILHGLARRFLSDAVAVSEIFLQRIAASEQTLQELKEGAKKAVKEEGCFEVHLQRVRDLAKEAEKDFAAIQLARERVNAAAADLSNLSLAEPIDAVQSALENVLRMQRVTTESWGWMEDAERALQVVTKNFVTEVSIHTADRHNKIEQVRFFSETSFASALDAGKLYASSQRMQQYGEQLRNQRKALSTIRGLEETTAYLKRASELFRNVISHAWTAPLPPTRHASFAAALKRASQRHLQQQQAADEMKQHQEQQQEESSDEAQQHLADKQQSRPRKRLRRRSRNQQQLQHVKLQPQRSAESTKQRSAGGQKQQRQQQQQSSFAEQQKRSRDGIHPRVGKQLQSRIFNTQHTRSEESLSETSSGEDPETVPPTLEDLRMRLLFAVSAAAEGVAGASVGGSSWGTASSRASGEEEESLGFSGFHRSSDLLAEWLRQVEAADFAAGAMRSTIRQLQEAGGQMSMVAAADQSIELALVAAERFKAAAKLAIEGKCWARLEEDLQAAIQVYREVVKSPGAPPAAVLKAHHLTTEVFLSKASAVGRQRDLSKASRMACELSEFERKLFKLVREHKAATRELQLQQLGAPLPQQTPEAHKEEVLALASTAEELAARAQRDALLLVEKTDRWVGRVGLPEVRDGALAVRNAELRVRDISRQLHAALGKLRNATTASELGQAGFEVLRAKEEMLNFTRIAHSAYQKSLLAVLRAGRFAHVWTQEHSGQVAVRPKSGYADSLQEALSSAWHAVELREQLLARAYVELKKFPSGDPRIVLTESRLRDEGAMVSAFLQHLQGLLKQASAQGSMVGVLPALVAEAQTCVKSLWQLALCVDVLVHDKQNSLDLVDALVPNAYL